MSAAGRVGPLVAGNSCWWRYYLLYSNCLLRATAAQRLLHLPGTAQLRCYDTGEGAIARKHSGNGQFSRQNGRLQQCNTQLNAVTQQVKDCFCSRVLFWTYDIFSTAWRCFSRPSVLGSGQPVSTFRFGCSSLLCLNLRLNKRD